MKSRHVDDSRISVLGVLNRAGLAVLAGAAFAYLAWNPMPPPLSEPAGDEVDDGKATAVEVRLEEVCDRNTAIERIDGARAVSPSWALVTRRSGGLEPRVKDMAGTVIGDISPGSYARLSAKADGAAEATGRQRPRGPPGRATL